MFSIKKTVSGIFFIFTLWLTGCGLPPGPDVAPTFATINTPTLPLSVSGIDSKNPQIAVDGSNNIFVVWQDSNYINFASSNGGSSFSAPIPVPGSVGGAYPRLTTDGKGNAYVIWQSSTQFLLNYSTTNGFQSSISISSICPGQSAQNPVPQADITYAGMNLFIAWAQISSCSGFFKYNMLFNSLPIANLSSGSPPTPVNILSDSSFAGYPKIAQFAGNPYTLFLKTSVSDLALSEYSTTSGLQNTFQVNTQNISLIPISSSLGVDGNGNSYVAWEASKSGKTGVDIFFNFLKAGSTQFNSSPQNLSNNGNSKGHVVGIDSSQYVYVAFFSRPATNPTAYDVFLERSADGGKSFIGPMNISNTSGDSASYAPGMAISGKTAYIVWDDNTISTNHQIYFQKVTLN